MKRFCRQCLFYEGMRFWLHPHTIPKRALPLTMDDQGVCSVCRLYSLEYDAESQQTALLRIERARDAPVIALYSGGKDSTAMLAYAKRVMKLDLKALLFDNGLIPPKVIERAGDVCQRLGVDLYIITREDLPSTEGIPDVHSELDKVSSERLTPCVACAGHVMLAAAELSRRTNATWLLQGTNYFAGWEQKPGAVRFVTMAGYTMRALHLPYALGWTASNVREQLAAVQFETLELQGVSSNCVVPGLVQARVARSIGHVPELEDLSLEVLVGHLTREQAIDELARKAPAFADLIASSL